MLGGGCCAWFSSPVIPDTFHSSLCNTKLSYCLPGSEDVAEIVDEPQGKGPRHDGRDVSWVDGGGASQRGSEARVSGGVVI